MPEEAEGRKNARSDVSRLSGQETIVHGRAQCNARLKCDRDRPTALPGASDEHRLKPTEAPAAMAGAAFVPGATYALKKAKRSALMTSAWVVAMPCGKPL